MFYRLCQLAPILFFVNSLVLGLVQANYSPLHQTISQLVHTPYGLWQTINFLLCGLLTLIFANLLRNKLDRNLYGSQFVLLGAFTFGISLVLLGLFPTDEPGKTSLVGQLHGLIFITTVLVQAALQFLAAKNSLPLLRGVYLLFSAAVTFTGLLALLLLKDNQGLTQRVFVGAIVVWVTASAYWLRKQHH